MAGSRASIGLRENRRRRSVAEVAKVLQQLEQAPSPLSQEELLELHRQLALEPASKQPLLPLSLPKSGAG